MCKYCEYAGCRDHSCFWGRMARIQRSIKDIINHITEYFPPENFPAEFYYDRPLRGIRKTYDRLPPLISGNPPNLRILRRSESRSSYPLSTRDLSVDVITTGKLERPDRSSNPLPEVDNCWSWAINPVTGVLHADNPPQIESVCTVDDLRNAVKTYFIEKGCTCYEYEENNYRYAIRSILPNYIMIAMRTNGERDKTDPDYVNGTVPFNANLGECDYSHGIKWDYHYALYTNGEWSARQGKGGHLYVGKGPSVPEGIWLEHDINKTATRREVHFPEGGGHALKKFRYKDPTLYLLVKKGRKSIYNPFG